MLYQIVSIPVTKKVSIYELVVSVEYNGLSINGTFEELDTIIPFANP